jgi:HAD superfamily hydrolase (TIGR01662 family)
VTTSTSTVVVPTVGRSSLHQLLRSLDRQAGDRLPEVVVVDDRSGAPAPLDVGCWPHLRVRVLRSHGGGPAHARNVGWRAARTAWVSFLDDDVLPDTDWLDRLATDLAAAGPDVAASKGNVRVPLDPRRRPTDWERSTKGLETAQWITADMSVRRDVLAAVGGIDERFRRAYREDADLGLRITGRGWRIVDGERCVTHPVRPADDWASLRQQAGNADDFLMRALHGPDWRDRCSAPRGRRARRVAVTAAAAVTVLGLAAGRRRAAAVSALGWLAGTVELAWARVAPGPRDPAEVRRMVLTSAAIPLVATWHSARGAWAHRHAQPWRGLPDLVLLDRDGTLVHDVPYNGDPALVAPVPGARESLDRLRSLGVRVGLVSNQSGVSSGRITVAQVEALNRRLAELVGPFDVVRFCPHGRDEGCTCRKPAPGMVKDACAALGVEPDRCLLVGDIASDVEAAEAAGARAILVPTAATRAEEVDRARRDGCLARTLPDAVDAVIAGRW